MKEKSILLWKVNTVSDTNMMHVSPHASSTAAKLVEKFKSSEEAGWQAAASKPVSALPAAAYMAHTRATVYV